MQELEAHREVVTDEAVELQFKMKSGAWVPARDVPPESIRAYEMSMLPTINKAQANSDEVSCSKDPLRATEESRVSRKSGGLLVAVYPCLHIVAAVPMYSSESLSQVVLLVWLVLTYMHGIQCVVYDFACGVLRHARKQAHLRAGKPSEVAWRKLLSLRWVVDKFHFGKGHTACRNPSSSYYEPSVNPYAYQELVGVDMWRIAGKVF